VRLAQNEWLDAGALTDAGKALNEQRFRDLEANTHAFVPREEARFRRRAPFKLKKRNCINARAQRCQDARISVPEQLQPPGD
jgi:hypothetical protein